MKKNPILLKKRQHELALSVEIIKKQARPGIPLEILEAGCGPSWLLDLEELDYRLTGVDVNEKALDLRKNQTQDLDATFVGDLRTIKLENGFYDVIYCSYVLEHIDGVSQVLKNFRKWLKPGGMLILRIPDGESVYGFVTKISPFWLHLFYKKVVKRKPMAGKPGHGPFPTVHEPPVSLKGMRKYCESHDWVIDGEYASNYNLEGDGLFRFPIACFMYLIYFLSLGRLAVRHNNLVFILQKPMEKQYA
jgi:SAM-dependent methyltransferase